MTLLPRRPRAAGFHAARCAAFFYLPVWAAAPALAVEPPPPWASLPATPLPMRLPVPDSPTWTLAAEAAFFEATDAVPVRGLSGDWPRYQPRDGRNAALQSARLDLVAQRERWEIAATVRSDILIRGSRGAWDVVHAYKQRQTPADGSAFAADADELGVIWAGVRGARTWTLRPGADHGLQFTAALSLLSVRRVQRTEANGNVQYSGATGYAFDAQTLRQDTHRQFGGYGTANARGQGWTSDVGLLWQPTEATFVNLSVADALSRLKVGNVATEEAAVSSSTTSTDANGFLDYKPLIHGQDSARDVSLRLSRKWTAIAGTRLGAEAGAWLDGATVGARWQRIRDVNLPALWAVVPLPAGLALQLDAETRFRSLGIGLDSRFGSVQLRTRSLPVGESRAIGWQASWRMPW